MVARARAGLWLAFILWGTIAPVFSVSSTSSAPVVIVPIEGTVDEGMAHLVKRSVDRANAIHAAAIVLDVNSPGGLVASVFEIEDALRSAQVPVIAYVSERAYSAASLITLSAQRIIVAPGASIGAAEPIPNTPKEVSALTAEFESTAERNHHNPTIAAGMVDRNVVIPGLKARGTILTLDTAQALRYHIAIAIEPTLNAALADVKLQNNPRETEQYTLGERIARFATDPTVSGILLSIGTLGIIVELWTLHGVAGAIGIAALALFFGAHYYAGFSNIWVIVLALGGLLLIVWELHVVPGHGLPGMLGVIALVLAVVFAFGFPYFFVGMETFGFSILATLVLFLVIMRFLPENAWMRRLALAHVQGPDYVSSRSFSDLQGQTGIAASYLRPSGIGLFGDRRVDGGGSSHRRGGRK